MKKNLIALAVLAASGVASAQSSVTAYGVADVWFGTAKTTVGGVGVRQTVLDSNGVSTSRFGFKGSEDLGGGLKANFKLEQGINIDTGAAGATGVAFNRQSWVGLSGGFGEVQLGKVWTSYDDIRSSANDTFNANIASSFSVWEGYNDRTNNGLKYSTPDVGGISGSVTYALGENKTATRKAGTLLSLGGQYASGPLFVGVAYQQEKAPVAGTKLTHTLFNASYDMKVAKLIGGYNVAKGTSATNSKAKEFNLGVEVPLSASLSLGAGYANSKLEVGNVDVRKDTGFSAAALYSLSKRTTLYAALLNVKTDFKVGADTKSTLYGLGVNHKF